MPAINAKALCEFIDASPTPYHAVDSAEAVLTAAGATRLYERDKWVLEPGRSYYLIRDDASLIAFRPGLKPPSETGFALSGAHADTPGLRARLEKSVTARGMERVAVEAYGGPIHSTWLDRPLSLAGRVILKEKDGALASRLINFGRPVAVIPNLAIHFNRDMNKGVEYPLNTVLLPVVSSRIPGSGTGGGLEGANSQSWLLRAVSVELDIEPGAIAAAELGFIEASPSIVFGMDGEFLSAPRIDNLEGCHAILTAFVMTQPTDHGQVAVFFDNEEIGSATTRGADSSFLHDILSRIVSLTDDRDVETMQRALARSLSVSVDGAQGWHPSYADKFDEDYAPLLNGGPAVKSSANVRYATDAIGEATFGHFCESACVPCRKFRMRADLMPGTTIGPISSALLGVRTIDVGVPMLAMHSVRELGGSYDHDMMISALKALYELGPSTIH